MPRDRGAASLLLHRQTGEKREGEEEDLPQHLLLLLLRY